MPTYSDRYQIKLITLGEEAGTWGDSTNQNLLRIEESLGASTVISVNEFPVSYTHLTLPTIYSV